MIYEYGGWIVLGILMFALFYLVREKIRSKNVWTTLINKYRDSMDEKLGLESEFVARYGSIENKSLSYKLDRLILTDRKSVV